MTKAEMRRIALGAVRSEMRRLKMDPAKATRIEVWSVLDAISRYDRDLVASQWYLTSSNAQARLFDSEWRQSHEG